MLFFLLLHQHPEGSLILSGWFWSSIWTSLFLSPPWLGVGESEPTPLHSHGWNGLCQFQKLPFPLAAPHPSISLWGGNLGNGTENDPRSCSCGGCALMWSCFNGALPVPAGSPCPGAVCVFPRNAKLVLSLRNSNVPEPSCHPGHCPVGPARAFGTQWCCVHF